MTPRRVPGSAATWAVALVVGSLLLTLLFKANPEALGGPRSAGSDSYSYSLLGYRAWAEVLERSGFEVTRRRTRTLSHLDSQTVVVVGEPYDFQVDSLEMDSETAGHLGAVAEREARVLFILPKWSGAEDIAKPGWLHRMERVPERTVRRVASAFGFDSLKLADVPAGATRFATAWGESLTVDVPALRASLRNPSSQAVVWRDSLVLLSQHTIVVEDSLLIDADKDEEPVYGIRSRHATVYLLADPDLLNNRGLARADHALLLRRFLQDEAGARRVVFDETTHHGALQGSLAAASLKFPLVLILIQSVLLLGFLLWGQATRFGAPRALPPAPVTRTALVDATAELIAAAAWPAQTLQLFWFEVAREVASRCGLPASSHRDSVAALSELARRRGVRGDAVQLDRDVEVIQRGDQDNARSVLELARSIQDWHRGMVHGL